MEIRSLVLGELQANCYVVRAAPAEGSCVVIDPGAEAERIRETFKEMHASPSMILLTHAHVDHMGACQELLDAFPGAKLALHKLDCPRLGRPTGNLSIFFGRGIRCREPDRELEDGDEIEAAGISFRVVHTPGHTPGSIVLVTREGDETCAFTGDTLFASGVGRTDFPGGSAQDLEHSITERLYSLPDSTLVYPGHGPETTIGEEKRYNPFVRG